MRLRIVLLTGLCLLSLIVSGYAEVDLERLSLVELYDLRDEIDQKIKAMEQTSDELIYDSGTYKIGEDIPAGDYVLIENADAMFASVIVREEASEDSGVVSSHLINGQAVIRLYEGRWLTLSEARAYPLSQAPRIEDSRADEGGYLVGVTLPAGTYAICPSDRAPLSSYSVYNGILGTGAQLIKFEVLHDRSAIVLSDGDYIELSGCGLEPALQ